MGGDAFALLGPGGDTALLLGLAATRVAVAFLLVPLFTADLIPALVRNAMFLAIAMLSIAVQPAAAAPTAAARTTAPAA